MLNKLFVAFSFTLLSPTWSQMSLDDFGKGPKGCVPGQDGTNNMLRMRARTKINSVTNNTIFCEEGQAGEFPCNGVDLQSFLNITDLFDGYQGNLMQATINDIWGWTSPDTGNEYALLGTSLGSIFIDVTAPSDPIILGMLPTHTFSSSWFDIKTYSNHAFVVSEATGFGMQVYDLFQLDDLSRDTRDYNLPETAHYKGVGSSHNIVINEDSGFAYLVGSKTCNDGGLHMVDISDPTNPTFAGCFRRDGYTHDAQCVNYDGPDSRYAGREICFCSNESRVTIVDVTNKAAPKVLSKLRYNYSRFTYTHQGWLTEDKSLFMFGDELKFGPSTTYIVDVNDLENPELKQQFCQEMEASTHNQYVKGIYTYQSNYKSGLRILDTEVYQEIGTFEEEAFFDTFPAADDNGFEGSWSNYPYFESGNVIVSGINEGMFVVTPHIHYDDTSRVRNLHAEVLDEIDENNQMSQRMHITITVHDHNDNPIEGAEVTGAFYHGIKKSRCRTDFSGQCMIKSKSFSNGVNDITFSVRGIMYPNHRYNKKENEHTSITARKLENGFKVTKSKKISLENRKRSNLWAFSKFYDKVKNQIA